MIAMVNKDTGEKFVGTMADVAKWYAGEEGVKVYIEEDEDTEELMLMALEKGAKEADYIDSLDERDETEMWEKYYAYIEDDSDYFVGEAREMVVYFIDYDTVLDGITAREVRDSGLDLDEEIEIREWYGCYKLTDEENEELMKGLPGEWFE
jgi:hypothetical protein